MGTGKTAIAFPNVDDHGRKIAETPPRSVGGWRGRAGYQAISKMMQRTRFRIRPDADSPTLWCAWNFVEGIVQHGKKRKLLPLVCTVCGDVPERVSCMNFVSGSKSSGQCSCSFRPEHGSGEGRARLQRAVQAEGHDLVDGEGEWCQLHLHRSHRWELVHVRCRACGRERHVPSGGLMRNTPLSKCLCARKGRRGACPVPPVIVSVTPSPSASQCGAEKLASARSDDDEDDGVASVASAASVASNDDDDDVLPPSDADDAP